MSGTDGNPVVNREAVERLTRAVTGLVDSNHALLDVLTSMWDAGAVPSEFRDPIQNALSAAGKSLAEARIALRQTKDVGT